MSRAALPVLVWAGLLTVLAAVLWLWEEDNVPPAIFSVAAAVAWLVGLFAWFDLVALSHKVRVTPDLSLASVLIALAIAMLALGALVGRWLVLIGAGALLIGLVGVARELVGQRRLR